MKKAIFLFSLLVVMSAATAFAGTLVSSSNIIVWQSEDAYKACMAELKETSGKPGSTCMSATAALVPSGTKAIRLEGFIFLKIRILDGPNAGVVGYVPVEFYKR